MRSVNLSLKFCLVLLLLCSVLSLERLSAQEESEETEKPATTAEDSGSTDSEKPAVSAEDSASAESEKPAEIPPPKNSPLVTEPKSADELMDAISFTLEIARLDATKIYLQQFLALKLDEQELSRLRRKHGPSLYLRLANNRQLQPESLQFLELSNEAFAKQVGDPEQIRMRVRELQGDPETREAAYVELRGIGVQALPGILQEFYKTDDPKLQESLGRLLVTIGRPAVPPLVGALETDSTVLLLAVIRALEQIGDQRTAEHLWYYSVASSQPQVVQSAAQSALRRLVPGESGAIRGGTAPTEQLRQLTRKYFRGAEVDRDPFEDEHIVWNWDSETRTIVSRTLAPAEASLQLALKFAKQALELSPQDEELQTVYLTGLLEQAVQNEEGILTIPEGKGTPYEAGLKSGGDKVSRVLEIALEDRRIPAAVAACRILGKVGSSRQLQQGSGHHPALILALNDPSPRVQYEAAQAIVQMNPSAKFPHSNRVVQILARALVSEETSAWNALIADPSLDRGTGLMGMVRALGAESQLATTGEAAFASASSEAPPDFILMNVGIGRWGLTETLMNLRNDVRTANIPVVLFGPPAAEDVIENNLSDKILDEKLAMADRIKALEDLHSRVRTSGGSMDKSRLRKLSDLIDSMIDKRQRFENMSPETILEYQARALQEKLAAAGVKKDDEIIGKGRLIEEKRKLRKEYETDRKLDRQMEAGLRELMSDLVVKSVRTPGQLVRPEKQSGPIDFRKKFQQELADNSTLFYIEEPQSSEDFKEQIQPFQEKIRSAGMSPQERQRQARLAAITLAEVGTGKLSKVFPLEPEEAALLQASHNLEILYDVLTAMSVLSTPAIQNRLAEISVNEGIVVELRTKATEHLTSQVNQAGNRLLPEAVRRLTILSDTATDDKLQSALQALLGSLKPSGADLVK